MESAVPGQALEARLQRGERDEHEQGERYVPAQRDRRQAPGSLNPAELAESERRTGGGGSRGAGREGIAAVPGHKGRGACNGEGCQGVGCEEHIGELSGAPAEPVAEPERPQRCSRVAGRALRHQTAGQHPDRPAPAGSTGCNSRFCYRLDRFCRRLPDQLLQLGRLRRGGALPERPCRPGSPAKDQQLEEPCDCTAPRTA